MTNIQPYLDRLDITLTEYPEDPWGRIEGTVFYAQAEWRKGAKFEGDERTLPLLVSGRGATRDEAIRDFRKSVEWQVGVIEEARRRAAVKKNPTSIERITL